MPAAIPGIHHVTAIGSDPGRNLAFYTGTLGLRLVKRSVNQDDVSVYHLFYGDRSGSPGTSMTFFPYPDARRGRVGTGQVSTVAFLIPEDSVGYWIDRLDEAGVDVDADGDVDADSDGDGDGVGNGNRDGHTAAADTRDRFGDTVVSFSDPDGVPLELVARSDAPRGDPPGGPVPREHAIRGFFGVTLSLQSAGPTADLLETMGYRETQTERDRRRFEVDGDLGYVVDVLEDPQAPRGVPGAGTVHHVAFQVTADDQPEWRDVLIDRGLRPTEIIDRKWFESVYVRTPGGVLFEFATKSPGYTVDEDVDELGERLVLPEWLEDRREEIEAGLPELTTTPSPE